MIQNSVSLKRWLANPWQCIVTLHIMLWGVFQITLGSQPPQSVLGDLGEPILFWFAMANVIGGLVCLIGLLLRDQTRGEWIEMGGYLSLGATSGTYVFLLIGQYGLPNTTFSYFMSNAIFWSSLFRSVQIVYWKYKRRNGIQPRDHVAEVKAEVAEEIRSLEDGI